MRQWVLSFPFPLRFLFASQPIIMGKVLGIVYRAIATHVTRKAGYTETTAQTGAVTLIQCFGGSLWFGTRGERFSWAVAGPSSVDSDQRSLRQRSSLTCGVERRELCGVHPDAREAGDGRNTVLDGHSTVEDGVGHQRS